MSNTTKMLVAIIIWIVGSAIIASVIKVSAVVAILVLAFAVACYWLYRRF